MKKNLVWLFNFSSSWSGGGLIRTLETIKWFDENFGASFIISDRIKDLVSSYNKKNKYFFVSENKIKRLVMDGYYMPEIIDEIGRPDIYFSYGIPVFNNIAKINWFHISNALTLKTNNISLPLITRFKMWILKKRIIKTMNNTDIATGESKFSINLLKEENKKRNITCHYDVLPNGYDISLLEDLLNKKREQSFRYAITIGTFSYKKIDVALELFQKIKETYNLQKFIIIGPFNHLPKSIINDEFVEFKSNISREELFSLLYNAEYYISASQIENSSIAALEALLLSKNIILSNIPSHNEMIKSFKTRTLFLRNSKVSFNMLENNNKKIDSIPWINICEKLFHIIDDFNNLSR
jgi:glycosyltransferase involved in cell wall biosynthesis